MLCRLYDTKNKRYIKAEETLDYMVHPVGAVFVEGAEDHRIITELSVGRNDMNDKEVFAGDVIADDEGNILGEVRFIRQSGVFGVFSGGRYLTSCRGRLKNLRGIGKFQVVGTTHDEEMEAE